MEKFMEDFDLKKHVGNIKFPKKLTVNKQNVKLFFDENVEHFKTDKWKLSLTFLVENLFYHMFGVHASDLIIKNLIDNKIKVKLCVHNDELAIAIIEPKKKAIKKKSSTKKKAKKK